jgi:hypothetical protein
MARTDGRVGSGWSAFTRTCGSVACVRNQGLVHAVVGPGIFADVRLSWEGRPPRRPTNHFGPDSKEKNGTAQRPSLPEMNELRTPNDELRPALRVVPRRLLDGRLR